MHCCIFPSSLLLDKTGGGVLLLQIMGKNNIKLWIFRTGGSAVKAVPWIGTLHGIGSQRILSGSSTYALGKVFQFHFENNGTDYNFDVGKR